MYLDHLPVETLVEYFVEYFAMGLVMTMMEKAGTSWTRGEWSGMAR